MKMNTIIKEENRDKICKALEEVQKRARTRLINFVDIEKAVSILERKFEGIPVSEMKGVKAEIDMNGQAFSRSYSGIPDSTHFTIIRTMAGWKIIDIRRDHCDGATTAFRVTLTEEAKRALIKSRMAFRAR